MINIWLFGLILTAVIVLGWVVFLFLRNGKRFDFDCGEFFPLAPILIIFWMAYLIFGLCLNDIILQNGKVANIHYEYSEIKEIYSLEDNIVGVGVNGSFRLGYGTINSDPDNLYYFIYINTENGLKCTKYSSEDTFLVQDENEKPYIIKKTKYCDFVYDRTFLNGTLFTPIKDDIDVCIESVYQLHVPENTIKVKYNSDVQ